MGIGSLLIIGAAAIAGYVITTLLLPLMGLAGDPGPPFTGAFVWAVAAAVVVAIIRWRRTSR